MTLAEVKKLKAGDSVAITQLFTLHHLEVMEDRVRVGIEEGKGFELPYESFPENLDISWIQQV